VFYAYFYNYNHAHRLRLEKQLYLELPGSSKGHTVHFKPLLDPGGGFTSETAAEAKRPLRNRLRSEAVMGL
jgi:hypothetical protein